MVDLPGGGAADGVAAVQENFHQADDPRVMDLDAGIADCAYGNGQGETLQQREVDVHIQRLGLKAGKAVGDDLKLLAHLVEVIQSLPEAEIIQIVR